MVSRDIGSIIWCVPHRHGQTGKPGGLFEGLLPLYPGMPRHCVGQALTLPEDAKITTC